MTVKIILNNEIENYFRKNLVNSQNKQILSRIENIKKLDFQYYFHSKKKFDQTELIFTVFVTVHNTEIEFIKKSIQSTVDQDYLNTEIIIVNHGCNQEISNYLKNIFENNSNFKLIVIKDNEFSDLDDSTCRLANLWNFALFISEGDYSIPLACDDFISKNYATEIIKIFRENKNCKSVLTNVKSVNSKDEINQNSQYLIDLKRENKIYFDRKYLLTHIMEKNEMLTPGGNLVVNNEIIIFFGGYSVIHEYMQFFLFSTAGNFGFCDEAIYYWRHHPNQSNKKYAKLGVIWLAESIKWYNTYNVKKYHIEYFGVTFQKKFYKWFFKFLKKNEIGYFRYAYRFYGFKTSFKIIKSLFIHYPIILPNIILYFFIDIPYYIYVRFKLIKEIKNFFLRKKFK